MFLKTCYYLKRKKQVLTSLSIGYSYENLGRFIYKTNQPQTIKPICKHKNLEIPTVKQSSKENKKTELENWQPKFQDLEARQA